MNAPVILPLELRGVTYMAGGQRLIEEISVLFRPGPRSIIIGPNGAGKSLLLRLCHGLIRPHAGRVVWGGAASGTPDGVPARPPAPLQAMVFQRPVMLRRSVAANVAYGLALGGVPRDRRPARVDEALERTGLGRFARLPARVLSFGEQQRLALARAWALKPQVLFLDEPTASLDPSATHAVEEIINGIHADGTRIIMTTHDLSQARRLADEVLFLHRGRLIETAPAEAFFTRPQSALAQAFIGGELLWEDRRQDTQPLEAPS